MRHLTLLAIKPAYNKYTILVFLIPQPALVRTDKTQLCTAGWANRLLFADYIYYIIRSVVKVVLLYDQHGLSQDNHYKIFPFTAQGQMFCMYPADTGKDCIKIL